MFFLHPLPVVLVVCVCVRVWCIRSKVYTKGVEVTTCGKQECLFTVGVGRMMHVVWFSGTLHSCGQPAVLPPPDCYTTTGRKKSGHMSHFINSPTKPANGKNLYNTHTVPRKRDPGDQPIPLPCHCITVGCGRNYGQCGASFEQYLLPVTQHK